MSGQLGCLPEKCIAIGQGAGGWGAGVDFSESPPKIVTQGHGEQDISQRSTMTQLKASFPFTIASTVF